MEFEVSLIESTLSLFTQRMRGLSQVSFTRSPPAQSIGNIPDSSHIQA